MASESARSSQASIVVTAVFSRHIASVRLPPTLQSADISMKAPKLPAKSPRDTPIRIRVINLSFTCGYVGSAPPANVHFGIWDWCPEQGARDEGHNDASGPFPSHARADTRPRAEARGARL